VTEQYPRRLSVPRVILALALLLGVLATAGVLAFHQLLLPANKTEAVPPPWFAPYVDVTLTPTYSFQDPAENPAHQVLLGFVVAGVKSPCTPSWGGAFTLSQAATRLDLARRIVQYHETGGYVMVSFGGNDNQELALACHSEVALESAYASVVQSYSLTAIDFDLEGAALTNAGSLARRAVAVAALQHSMKLSGENLAVWLTLPVEANGLQTGGSAAIRAMVDAGVDLAGVNVLAMDFGSPTHPVTEMLSTTESALRSTERQLAAMVVWPMLQPGSKQLWNKLGVTIMIGQNDFVGEEFSFSAAKALRNFAIRSGLGRVSIWSLNRDSPCGSNDGEVGILSDTCSGAVESPQQYDSMLAGLAGSAIAASSGGTDSNSTTPPTFPAPVPDNQATAPYPIWQPDNSYTTGYKVVWQSNVYQAKWFNEEEAPGTPVQSSSQTPWLLIGPVLAGDHTPTISTVPAGTYPKWSAATDYIEGSVVLQEGLPYRAKWYNEGDQPTPYPTDANTAPWLPLFSIPGEPSSS
jgi:chitinase